MRLFAKLFLLGIILSALSAPLAAQSPQPMYIYVPNGAPSYGEGLLSVFEVNPSTGALTAVPGSPFEVGSNATAVVVDPTGRFVYVMDTVARDVWSFSVDPTSGSLTLLPGSPINFEFMPSAIAVDPTGRFLYVSISSGNAYVTSGMLLYSIDPTAGVLSAVSGPQVIENPLGLAIDPSGTFLYFYWASGESRMVTESINFETGIPSLASDVFYGPSNAPGIAIDPLDRFAAVNGPVIFTIDPIAGSLTPTGTTPFATSGNSAFDPSGRFLYSVDNSLSSCGTSCPLAGYQVDPQSGALTPIAGSPFAAGTGFQYVASDPTGQFVYAIALDGTGSAIYGFSLSSSTGALTPLAGSPWPMTYSNFAGPMAISFAPNGVTNPAPAINSLSPLSALAAGGNFTLTVNGTDFVPGARVYFGGRGRVTTYVSPTQLTATILSADIATGGTGVVFVYNPPPAGGASSSVEFFVTYPVPVISSITPVSAAAGGNAFNLTVNGSNFFPSSLVTFNGVEEEPAFVSSTQLYITVSVDQIAVPGTAIIGVTNPPVSWIGGGNSATLPLTITPAGTPPTIDQLAPGSVTAGGPAFTLEITGSNFTSSAVVTFGSTTVPVTSSGTTVLFVSVPASAITTAGTASVTVTTAGGTSNSATCYVNNPPPMEGGINPPSVPAGSAALTLNVTGTGFAPGSTVLVNGSSRVTTYVSSTLLQATLLASDFSQGGTLVITVSSPGPGGGVSAPITLTIADYAVSAAKSAASIAAGQPANYTLTIAPANGAYTNPVTFTVSGLPAGASASFSPSATVTPGNASTTVTLSIATTAHSLAPAGKSPQWPVQGAQLLVLVGLGLVIFGTSLCSWRTRPRRFAPQFMLAILLVIVAGLAACSAGNSSSQINTGTGTPAGTYSVIVTATSGGDVHITTITLTVM
jgi:6-phosphogluconolactonase (cycloisomerase 2 family)